MREKKNTLKKEVEISCVLRGRYALLCYKSSMAPVTREIAQTVMTLYHHLSPVPPYCVTQLPTLSFHPQGGYYRETTASDPKPLQLAQEGRL